VVSNHFAINDFVYFCALAPAPSLRDTPPTHAPLNRQPEESKLAPSDPELFLREKHL